MILRYFFLHETAENLSPDQATVIVRLASPKPGEWEAGAKTVCPGRQRIQGLSPSFVAHQAALYLEEKNSQCQAKN